MDRPDIALELRQVKKNFGGIEIIRGVDLAVRRGDRHAIIGPNGAGKSTLFNLISGRLPVSEGEILLNDAPIQNRLPHTISRMGLGRSFQINYLFSQLSTYEHIRLGRLSADGFRYSLARQASWLKGVAREAERLLRHVNLIGRRDIAAGNLAYSEQRSLEIAVTLSTGPDVVLLDEPTAGMSRDEAKKAVELVRETTTDKTLLIVEHDMDVVFSLCNRVSVLVYGRIIATGTPEEIRNNSQVQEAYLGVELGDHA
jgi:branched-chain amino acid transport system ATP-binding protein